MGWHELHQMPDGVDRLSLLLYQFAPGMVMAATVATLPADTAEDLFHRSHQSPIRRERGGGLSFQFVGAAKAADLEDRLRPVADALLPPGSGLLGTKRYPFGTTVVWIAEARPPDTQSWRQFAQVLGIEDWRWWADQGRRLYSGVPMADRETGGRGGYSMLIFRPTTSEAAEFGGVEAMVRHELELELADWLPLLLLQEAALLITEQAGRLRETLNRRVTARLRALRFVRLSALVTRLDFCRYQLERVRQGAGLDTEVGFRQFPVLLLGSMNRKPALRSRFSFFLRISRLGRPDSDPKPAEIHLRSAAIDGLERLTKAGLHEVRLTLDRARLLAEVRSTNALLSLTAVVALLTAILVLRDGVGVLPSIAAVVKVVLLQNGVVQVLAYGGVTVLLVYGLFWLLRPGPGDQRQPPIF